ncbi:hypothetical protein EYF80_038102 [Liparis tanakae]|uniref:Transmembrane protein n=1 Tax=Liparis tanakae TaxID=230148 RepID=A0A4Z2GEI6_9TELE|nr:hypothetical protein EYF80_038102 [Liparis tanakae]
MMLAPEPSDRPKVSELLALPSIRKHRWRRRVYLLVAETTLTLVSFCQVVVCFGRRLLSSLHILPHWNKPSPCTPPQGSWDRDLTLPLSAMHADSGSPEDDALFDPTDPELSPTFSHRVKSRLSVDSTSTPLPGSPKHNQRSPAHTRSYSNLGDWSSCNLAQTPSSIHSNGSCHTLTPSASPIHAELHADRMNEDSTRSSTTKSSQRGGRNWVRTEEALPRPNFEPKNLLGLFEDTTVEGQP